MAKNVRKLQVHRVRHVTGNTPEELVRTVPKSPSVPWPDTLPPLTRHLRKPRKVPKPLSEMTQEELKKKASRILSGNRDILDLSERPQVAQSRLPCLDSFPGTPGQKLDQILAEPIRRINRRKIMPPLFPIVDKPYKCDGLEGFRKCLVAAKSTDVAASFSELLKKLPEGACTITCVAHAPWDAWADIRFWILWRLGNNGYFVTSALRDLLQMPSCIPAKSFEQEERVLSWPLHGKKSTCLCEFRHLKLAPAIKRMKPMGTVQ